MTIVHLCRIALIVCLGLVTWQSLLPANGLQGVPHMDKVVHFLIYGLLCLLAIGSRLSSRYMWAFLGVIAFGLLIEILQGTMGWGRTASIWDMLANTLGAAIMFGLCVAYRKRRQTP